MCLHCVGRLHLDRGESGCGGGDAVKRVRFYAALTHGPVTGLLPVSGWEFSHRGGLWIVHLTIGINGTLLSTYKISHKESGFGISQVSAPSKTAAIRNFKDFVKKKTEQQLNDAMSRAYKLRPANKIKK